MTTDEIWQWLYELRGIETPCVRCGGAGVRAYATTAGWRGGAGGATMIDDTCDRCWGTGDEKRRGVSLREVERWKAAYDREQALKATMTLTER